MNQSWLNIGPSSATLAQHWFDVSCLLVNYSGKSQTAKKTRAIYPRLVQCWFTVCDTGPALYQHWMNVPGFLGVKKHTDLLLVQRWASIEDMELVVEQRCYNRRHSPNVWSKLIHRLRRWPGIALT